MENTESAESPHFSITADIYTEYAKYARASLIEILENHPELRQFVSGDTVANAVRVMKSLREILKNHPRLLKELAKASQTQRSGEIVMAILPNEPLVFMQAGGVITAFAPVLSCTLNAVGDLYQNRPISGDYTFVTSDNGLIPHVLECLEKDGHPIINYDRRTMNPADYIALGATGMFYNETFRMTLTP